MASAAKFEIVLRPTFVKDLTAMWECSKQGESLPLATFLGEIIESRVAEFRLLKITERQTLSNAKRLSPSKVFALPRQTRLSDTERNKMAAEYLQGTPVPALAVRFGKSEPVIYRTLQSCGIRKDHRNRRKAAQ